MVLQYQIFGIKTIYVNGFTVHTLCVRVKNNIFNSELIQKESRGLAVNFLTTKRGEEIELKYTSMDLTVFNLAAKTLGNILKQIAQENHNQKYQWTLNI